MRNGNLQRVINKVPEGALNMPIREADLNEGLSRELSEVGTNALACFQCGGCSAYCPMSLKDGPQIRKLMRKANLGIEDQITSDESLWQCFNCSICTRYCPRSLDPNSLVRYLREEETRKIMEDVEGETINVFLCDVLQEEFGVDLEKEDVNIVQVHCSSNITPEVILKCVEGGISPLLVLGCVDDYECVHGEGRYVGASNVSLTSKFLQDLGLGDYLIKYRKVESPAEIEEAIGEMNV